MSPARTIRSAADSTVVLVISRLMMVASPFVATALIYLGQQYLDQRFTEIRSMATQAATIAAVAASSANTLGTHVSVIDANIASSVADRGEFQARISTQVDKLTDVVVSTSVQVSAIKATLDAIGTKGQGLASR